MKKGKIMARLRGKGSMTGVNLLAVVYDNSETKNGKTQFADVQVDHRDQRGADQTNLHLVSARQKDDKGQTRINNGAGYSVAQMDKIKEAAGPNTEPYRNKDGQEIGTVYGFKADVMPSSRGSGLVVNTNKEIQASEFKVDEHTIDNQFQSIAQAREAQAASREAQAEAPAAEQSSEQSAEAQAEDQEPAVG